MGRLIVLYILILVLLKFRFRRNPRIRAGIDRWFMLFTAALLLLVASWDLSAGTAGSVLTGARLAGAGALLVFLLVDIRKAVR